MLLTVQLIAVHAASVVSKALLQMVGPQLNPRMSLSLPHVIKLIYAGRVQAEVYMQAEVYQDCYLFLSSMPTSCVIADVSMYESVNASVIVSGSVNECM